MKAILITLLCATAASAQYVPAWEGFAQQCYPGGYCPPQVIWRPQPSQQPPQQDQPAEPEYEPRPNPNQEQPPPAVPPQSVKECDCAAKWTDFEKWKSDFKVEILAAIRESAAKPGPPGPAGPAGPPGKDGAPGKPVPAPQPTSEQHVVVVADQNAPYWQRLAEQISTTKKTYHGVQVAGLPQFPIGVHPQGVVYKNSVPVRIVKGQYEVEALLSRLARGEPI